MKLGRMVLLGLAITSGAIGCGADEEGTATVVVQIHTDGGTPDPDGYTLSIEGWGDTLIATNDTLQVELRPGLYFLADNTSDDVPAAAQRVVSLAGVAENCDWTHSYGPYTLEAGATDTLGYSVHCTATTGSLSIRMVTNGVALDPDGYQITIDGGAPFIAGINTPTTAKVLAVGDHSVALSGVVMNCTPEVLGPVTVNIEPAEADTLWWAVDCGRPRVAIQLAGTPTDGLGLINPDGSNLQLILPNAVHNNGFAAPAISPDGETIAFTYFADGGGGPRRIGLTRIDSIEVVPVHVDSTATIDPRWAPDGASLLVSRRDSAAQTYHLERLTIANGSLTTLTPDSFAVVDGDASPDGTRIVFAGIGGSGSRLYIMNADGSGLTQITPDSLDDVAAPRWSPVEDKIIFTADSVLWTVSSGGGGLTKIPIPGYRPIITAAWSPSGTQLVVTAADAISRAWRLVWISASGAVLGASKPPAGFYVLPDWR